MYEMKRRGCVWSLILLVCLGCERTIPVTGNQMASARLFELGDAIVVLSKEQDVFRDAPTLGSLVMKLESAKVLSTAEGKSLLFDPWGKQIRIEYNKQKRIVILMSAGLNSIFENGENDDVVAEIHIPLTGSPRIVRRYLGPDGQAAIVTISYETPAKK